MQVRVHQHDMHYLQLMGNEVLQVNFFTKDKSNRWKTHTFTILMLCKYYPNIVECWMEHGLYLVALLVEIHTKDMENNG